MSYPPFSSGTSPQLSPLVVVPTFRTNRLSSRGKRCRPLDVSNLSVDSRCKAPGSTFFHQQQEKNRRIGRILSGSSTGADIQPGPSRQRIMGDTTAVADAVVRIDTGMCILHQN